MPSKNINVRESSLIKAGDEISLPVKTPIGNIGLAIVFFFKTIYTCILIYVY